MFDVNKLKQDFPMFQNNPELIYLDSCATTFKPTSVIESVNYYYTSVNCNTHASDYKLAYRLSKEIEEVRENIASFINAETKENIVFTNGTTMSLNTVAYSFLRYYLKAGDVIYTTYLEHSSSIIPLFNICKEIGCIVKYIKLNDNGTFNLEEFEKAIDDKVKFISIIHASNVLGYINPIKEIIEIAHKHNILVSVDGAQSVPHISIDVQELDVDFLSFSAHKMLGPNGIGVLYAKKKHLDFMKPFIQGGGSNARFDQDGNVIYKQAPYCFESGTLNLEAMLGLNRAIKYVQELGLNQISEHEKALKKYADQRFKELANVEVYNDGADLGIVSFNVKDIFAQDVSCYLDSLNIAVRSGNHCAKLIHHVIGCNQCVRASFYVYTSFEDIDKLVKALSEITLEKCIGVGIYG